MIFNNNNKKSNFNYEMPYSCGCLLETNIEYDMTKDIVTEGQDIIANVDIEITNLVLCKDHNNTIKKMAEKSIRER